MDDFFNIFDVLLLNSFEADSELTFSYKRIVAIALQKGLSESSLNNIFKKRRTWQITKDVLDNLKSETLNRVKNYVIAQIRIG